MTQTDLSSINLHIHIDSSAAIGTKAYLILSLTLMQTDKIISIALLGSRLIRGASQLGAVTSSFPPRHRDHLAASGWRCQLDDGSTLEIEGREHTWWLRVLSRSEQISCIRDLAQQPTEPPPEEEQ